MKIGDFRFPTDNRNLSACIATLGVPLKEHGPIVNSYSERNPVPQVPFGHPRWRCGKLIWMFEAASETCFKQGTNPYTPKDIAKAFFDKDRANKSDESIAAIDAAFAAGNVHEVARLWQIFKDDLPAMMAGFIRLAMDNRERLFKPLLEEAYKQQKKTGLGPDIVTISEGEGEIHTTKNPSEEVKEALL